MRWSFYAWLIIGFLVFLLILRWPLLPNFLDIYYHLACAEGFAKAGGFVTHDFWSYAPIGRPHLYPPLFHFLILALLKSGIPPLSVARLLDVIIFPSFLSVIWFFMRSIFDGRKAFFAVLISASLYSFYLAGSNFMPATLACIFGLLSLWAAEKGKIISASIFLSLGFYSHAQIPWFFALTLIGYGFLNRVQLRRSLTAVFWGLFLSLPILVYLFSNRGFYNPKPPYENFVLELNLYMLLALFGLTRVFREKGKYFLLLSLALAALPFVFTYPYRYVSGQGLLGLVLLSTIGFDSLLKGKAGRPLLLWVLIFILFSPTIVARRSKPVNFSIFNSTYINLSSLNKSIQRTNEFSLSSSKFIGALVRIVKENSKDREIISSNLPFMGTVISALSGRADAEAMLQEVSPGARQDPLRQASLIIWFKDKEGKPEERLRTLVPAYNLQKLTETEIAYVYRNNAAPSQEVIPKANISSGNILIIFLLVLMMLTWDLSRKYLLIN